MTQQEFKNRTQVEVSYTEFDAIHEVYMNSDLDKDEFCKMWMKMNKTRVERAKAQAKAEAEEAAKREKLYDIINRYYTNEEYNMNNSEVLTEKEVSFLWSVGIECDEMFNPYWSTMPMRVEKSMRTIIYEIKQYLRAA